MVGAIEFQVLWSILSVYTSKYVSLKKLRVKLGEKIRCYCKIEYKQKDILFLRAVPGATYTQCARMKVGKKDLVLQILGEPYSDS